MPLNEEIQRLRDKVGLSQKALAEVVGVNQSFISKLERGESDRLGADVLLRIAVALGVDLNHFAPFLTGEATREGPVREPAPPKKADARKKPNG